MYATLPCLVFSPLLSSLHQPPSLLPLILLFRQTVSARQWPWPYLVMVSLAIWVFSSLQSLQQLVWGIEKLGTIEGAVGIAHQKKTQGPLLGKSLHREGQPSSEFRLCGYHGLNNRRTQEAFTRPAGLAPGIARPTVPEVSCHRGDVVTREECQP